MSCLHPQKQVADGMEHDLMLTFSSGSMHLLLGGFPPFDVLLTEITRRESRGRAVETDSPSPVSVIRTAEVVSSPAPTSSCANLGDVTPKCHQMPQVRVLLPKLTQAFTEAYPPPVTPFLLLQ